MHRLADFERPAAFAVGLGAKTQTRPFTIVTTSAFKIEQKKKRKMTISKGVYQDNGSDSAQAKIPVKFRGFVSAKEQNKNKQTTQHCRHAVQPANLLRIVAAHGLTTSQLHFPAWL